MKRTLLALALVVASATALHAQTASNPALEKKVRELIAITGSADLATQVIDQMMPALRQMAPDVPESFWSDMEKEMDVNSLIDQIVPVYLAEYSEREIDAMLTFYRSAEGKSVVKKMPSVMGQTMMIGSQWGQKAAERVIERLQQKGYMPKS